MKLQEINYQNTLDKIELKSGDVEEFAKNAKLIFFPENNVKIERYTKLPKFVPAFYMWVVNNKTVPTQEQFWQKYLSKNKKYFDEKQFDGDSFLAIRARAYRAYPSFVRDLHFALFLKEKIGADKVVYSAKLDIDYGIDVLLKLKYNHSVSLFANTARAIEARNWKLNRHEILEDVNYVDIKVEKMETPNFGEFFLYHQTEYNTLRD